MNSVTKCCIVIKNSKTWKIGYSRRETETVLEKIEKTNITGNKFGHF